MKNFLLVSLSMALTIVSSVVIAAETPAMPAPYPMPPPASAPGSVPAAPPGTITVPNQVKAGCVSDVKTTGCNQDMNHGFTRCLSEYMKAHPDYKISESCLAEAKAMRKAPMTPPGPPPKK